MRNVLVLVLTVFRDNYVRIGTLIGMLVGFWGTEFFSGDQYANALIFSFIGWGAGVYVGHYRSVNSQYLKKKKFRVFNGKR